MALEMVCALSPSELRFRVHEGPMDASRFIEFCCGLLRDIDGPAGLQASRPLPKGVWKKVMHDRIAGRVPQSKDVT